MIKDTDKEFGQYMFGWWFFGAINVIFVALYFYSTIVSFNHSVILFSIHIAVAVFFVFSSLVQNYNFNNMAKQSRGKNGKKN